MRYGIISDIHSNVEALKIVLAELDALGVEKLYCLGDVVGYGPNPNECCKLLRERNAIVIAGNHDEAAISDVGADAFNPVAREAIDWTKTVLEPENRAYLASLPRQRREDGFGVVHGAPLFAFDYILDVDDARRAFEHVDVRLTFVGHTHVAEVYYQDGSGRTFQQKLPHGGRIEIVDDYRYIINPGSVGQPRDMNPQAAYGFYDPQERTVELRRVSYDIGKVQERIEDAHLPSQLAARLTVGY